MSMFCYRPRYAVHILLAPKACAGVRYCLTPQACCLLLICTRFGKISEFVSKSSLLLFFSNFFSRFRSLQFSELTLDLIDHRPCDVESQRLLTMVPTSSDPPANLTELFGCFEVDTA